MMHHFQSFSSIIHNKCEPQNTWEKQHHSMACATGWLDLFYSLSTSCLDLFAPRSLGPPWHFTHCTTWPAWRGHFNSMGLRNFKDRKERKINRPVCFKLIFRIVLTEWSYFFLFRHSLFSTKQLAVLSCALIVQYNIPCLGWFWWN